MNNEENNVISTWDYLHKKNTETLESLINLQNMINDNYKAVREDIKKMISMFEEGMPEYE